jgi:hypothetical protein
MGVFYPSGSPASRTYENKPRRRENVLGRESEKEDR